VRGEHSRPFVELIPLADGWNQLDDERCSSLHDAITQNFGRPLALAALRGKLGHEGEIIDAPEPTDFVPAAGYAPAAPDQTAPAAYVRAAPAEAAPEGYVAASAADGPRFGGAAPAAGGVPVTGGVPAGGGSSVGPRGPALGPPPAVVVTTPGGVVTSGSPPVVAGGRVAPPGSPLVVEIRLSGERVQVETPEQRREREELLERL